MKIYQLLKPQNTFEVTLKYKGVNVRVAFVDGNNYRNIPAKCYTRDTFKQRAIEASKMFADHEIVLERAIEEESDRVAAAKKVERKTTLRTDTQKRVGVRVMAVGKPQNMKEAAGKLAADATGTVAGMPAEETAGVVAKPAEEPAGTGASGDDDGLEKKVFDNLADAILFIATNYQVQVQTPHEARSLLKEKGIKATIKQG